MAETNSVLTVGPKRNKERLGVLANAKAQAEMPVRCSIILPAGNDSLKLNAYLLYLSEARLPEEYELIVVNDQRLEIDERPLRDSLPTLKVLNIDHMLGQEQLLDRGAIAAKGKYLLLVKKLINFDKLMLEESIKDLETSGEPISISTNKNFVLVERFHFAKSNEKMASIFIPERSSRLDDTQQKTRRSSNKDTYLVNNEDYWDEYVENWENSEENKGLRYLGNEWKNEEIFLSLLKKYSNRNYKALEIGCGGGRITSVAINLFKRIAATDVSKEMLRKCRETIRDQNITFHKIDGFTLNEFEDESVDFIFSHDVFAHFSSLQVYPYFQEIKRVLKRNGIGLVSFYNFRAHFGIFKKMSLDFNDQRKFPPHMRIHFITEEMLRIMLEDLKIEIIEIEKTNFLIVVFSKQF